MKIIGLTTCVGEKYSAYLEKSLPIWLETLDEVHVVTDEIFSIADNHLCIHLTDLFTKYGASFNKGAALSHGFALIRDPEWILNFDADALPPENWRQFVEPKLSIGKLHGVSHRYREDGSIIPDADFPNIWGFFHLWHVDDPHSWKRPVFDPTCGHAGNYDHSFMNQWPEDCRVDFWPELKIIHQGEPRQSWFGRDPKNDKKMSALFTLGLWEAHQLKAGHIQVPPPYGVMNLDPMAVEEARQILKDFTDPDPFKYKVEIKCDTSAVASTK